MIYLKVLSFLIPKITFLALGLCMCVYAWVCVCSIRINQKRIVAESPKLLFYICIMFRCFLNLFMKIRSLICVQGQKKYFWSITAYGDDFLLVHFNIMTHISNVSLSRLMLILFVISCLMKFHELIICTTGSYGGRIINFSLINWKMI